MNAELIINEQNIQNKIYNVRNLQVMLDSDLAELYGVETKVFNQAVKRNIARFPSEFRFQITEEEFILPQVKNQILKVLKYMEEEDTFHMFLPNKAFLCSQQRYEVIPQYK